MSIRALSGGYFAGLNVYSMWGMMLVEGISFAPLTFLLLSAVLRATDTTFEEAAMTSGARPLKTFWTVTLPLALPGILALLLLVFIRAFESFEVPALVGLAGNLTVLTTNIYQSAKGAGPQQYGETGAYAVCLLVIVMLLIVWYNRLSRYAHKYQTITGKGYRPRLINLGKWRWLATAMLVSFSCSSSYFRSAWSLFASLQPLLQRPQPGKPLGRMTLENYRDRARPRHFPRRDRQYVVDGCGHGDDRRCRSPPSAPGWPSGGGRARGYWTSLQPHRWFFPPLCWASLSCMSFVSCRSRSMARCCRSVIASAVRFLPYGMRYAYAGVLQIHPELEDASSSAAHASKRLSAKIVVPLVLPALISCWLFVFLVASRKSPSRSCSWTGHGNRRRHVVRSLGEWSGDGACSHGRAVGHSDDRHRRHLLRHHASVPD